MRRLLLFAAAACVLTFPAACGSSKPSPSPSPTPTAPSPTPTPVPSPSPTPTTHEMSGVVRTSAPTEVAIVGARLEILDSDNAGKFTTSEGNGFYILRELKPGGFTMRATHAQHQTRDTAVSLTANRTQNVSMRPNPQSLDQTFNGQISGGTPATCSDGTFTKPCVRIELPIHNDGVLEAEMDWSGGSADLDLSLWRGTTIVARAVGVGSRERVSSQVTGGFRYYLHVTYYSGSNIVTYRVNVRRPN